MTLPPGSEIAGYRIEGRLGAGGMGTVYLCRHPRLPNRLVALKILADHLADDEAFVRRFEREADLGSRLNHPSIAHVYDAGVDKGHLWIAMEYVSGETLGDRLARSPSGMDVEIALHILRAAAGAIDHAHERGIVHRDIKPQNILLGNSDSHPMPVVKLVDFGIARENSSPATTNTFATFDFAAPELLLTQAAGSAASDIYSLACTAYVMLTGQLPFPRGDSLTDTLLTHVSGEPEPASTHRSFPPELDAALEYGLAHNPQDRPLTAKALVEEIAQAFAPAFAETPTQSQYRDIGNQIPSTDRAPVHGEDRTAITRWFRRKLPAARSTRVVIVLTTIVVTAAVGGAAIGISHRSPTDSDDALPSTSWAPVNIEQVSGALTLPHRPVRVAALGSGDAELVTALGVTPVIVSDGDNARPPHGIADGVPSAGTASAWNLGALTAARPDLIIDTDSDLEQDQVGSFQRVAPTMTRPPNSRMWQWTSRIRWIATGLGASNAANQVVSDTLARLAKTRSAHPEWDSKTIGVVIWDGRTIRTVHAPSSTSDLLQGLGFQYSTDVENYHPDEADPNIGPLGAGGDAYSYPDSDLDVGIVLRTDPARGHGGYYGLPFSLYTSEKPLVVIDDPQAITDLLVGGPLATRRLIDGLVPLLMKELGPS